MDAIRIKTPKTKKAISQKELAFFVGVVPSHISMILNGTRKPSPKLAKKLSKITGKPLSYWLFPRKVKK
jgi:transcriptional regulator with XRE-family HTH domain